MSNQSGAEADLKAIALDYDWKEAFTYAAKPTPVGECDNAPFNENDVAKVHAMSTGENDGPHWIMWGRLKDGRHFFLSAGCDYTGWDCQAGGDAWVSKNKGRLIDAAMDADARTRFGILSSPQGSASYAYSASGEAK
jgi:hypothetical protein